MNFETAERKLLQVVLAGQNELRDLLRREDLRQLRQRVSVRLDIVPLRAAEVEEYMRHRWHQGGGNGNFPFDREAVDLVAHWSHGIPRVMNAICDIALLRAFTSESAAVGSEIVREALGVLELNEPERIEAPVVAARPSLPLREAPAAPAEPRQALLQPLRQAWWNGVLAAGRRRA